MVTCRGQAEIFGKSVQKDNIITVNWHMPASFRPPLYALSIGKTRFSLGLIRSSRCFAVNFVDYLMKDAALICGSESGMSTDKFRKAGLSKTECQAIDCPRIKGCLAFLECEVVNEVDAGDHVIFIGKIIKKELLNESKRLFHVGDTRFIGVGPED